MKYRIVSDSSSNVFFTDLDVDYTTVPLRIKVEDQEFIDEPGVDCGELVVAMERSKDASKSSCPSPQDWMEAFEGADEIFAITISSSLSGSYNSAISAKDMYIEAHPEVKIHVVDSLSTGGEMELIMEKLVELFHENLQFTEIVDKISAYQKQTHLIFCLQSLYNLAKNGRLSPAIAKVAQLLNIKFIGYASDQGTIKQCNISHGNKKMLLAAVNQMLKMGYHGGKVRIDQCFNMEIANGLKDALLKKFPNADIIIRSCTALCTYYAERGGLIIGFE